MNVYDGNAEYGGTGGDMKVNEEVWRDMKVYEVNEEYGET